MEQAFSRTASETVAANVRGRSLTGDNNPTDRHFNNCKSQLSHRQTF
jgi:hypothetical protein